MSQTVASTDSRAIRSSLVPLSHDATAPFSPVHGALAVSVKWHVRYTEHCLQISRSELIFQPSEKDGKAVDLGLESVWVVCCAAADGRDAPWDAVWPLPVYSPFPCPALQADMSGRLLAGMSALLKAYQ